MCLWKGNLSFNSPLIQKLTCIIIQCHIEIIPIMLKKTKPLQIHHSRSCHDHLSAVFEKKGSWEFFLFFIPSKKFEEKNTLLFFLEKIQLKYITCLDN